MLNKIRYITRTQISCDLLLYGITDLDFVTNYKVFDAAQNLLVQLINCNFHNSVYLITIFVILDFVDVVMLQGTIIH